VLFEVFTACLMKTTVFWDMMLYLLVTGYLDAFLPNYTLYIATVFAFI
jgi:hypothetical protein